ncbi:hypothetical protein D3C78_1034470 [compost metagenome]
MADGQPHVVRGQRVSDVDHHLAAEIAQATQRLDGVGIGGSDYDYLAVSQSLCSRVGLDLRVLVGKRLRLTEVAPRNADLVPRPGQLTGEGGTHVATADNRNVHASLLRSLLKGGLSL